MPARDDRLARSRHASAKAPTDALFATLYAELHRLARRELTVAARLGTRSDDAAPRGILSIAGKDGAVFVEHARFMGYAAGSCAA